MIPTCFFVKQWTIVLIQVVLNPKEKIKLLRLINGVLSEVLY